MGVSLKSDNFMTSPRYLFFPCTLVKRIQGPIRFEKCIYIFDLGVVARCMDKP